jgi:hypothetical protein
MTKSEYICIKILEFLEFFEYFNGWKYMVHSGKNTMYFLGFFFLSHGTKEDKLHCKKGKEHNLKEPTEGMEPNNGGTLPSITLGALLIKLSVQLPFILVY